MGIVNVTPDSFSDGGCHATPTEAVEHALALVDEGADVIDVGGESTRPGADPVPLAIELERVIPVVEALAGHTTVSIDTIKPTVAREAVAAGATIINDVSAALASEAAELGVAWVAMHRRGDPANMQTMTSYDDVVAEVETFLAERVKWATSLGVEEIWIDPGIGFAKTASQNLELLARVDVLVKSGHRVLVGTSRKSFLGRLLATADGSDKPTPVEDRLEGSVATAVWAMEAGVRMIRVHDVAETVAARRLLETGPGQTNRGQTNRGQTNRGPVRPPNQRIA